MYYPIVLKIARRPILVVGGGNIAEGKVQGLLEAEAFVTVVSPTLTPLLQQHVEAGRIRWKARVYEDGDLSGVFLVIAATDDGAVQQRIWRDAQAGGVLINTVDRPELCDFIMPSVLRSDDVIVAVSTSGKSPAFAAWLRRRIAEFLTPEIGRVVAVLGSIRDRVRRRIPDIDERQRVYTEIFDSGITTWIRQCDDKAAEKRVLEMIEHS